MLPHIAIQELMAISWTWTSDLQEIILIFDENIKILEKWCRWEAYDVIVVSVDFTDEHTAETLYGESACAVDSFAAVSVGCEEVFGAFGEVDYGTFVYWSGKGNECMIWVKEWFVVVEGKVEYYIVLRIRTLFGSQVHGGLGRLDL